jgi:hypothetical protein
MIEIKKPAKYQAILEYTEAEKKEIAAIADRIEKILIVVPAQSVEETQKAFGSGFKVIASELVSEDAS